MAQPRSKRSLLRRPKISSLTYAPEGFKSKRISLVSPFQSQPTASSTNNHLHDNNMELPMDQVPDLNQFISTPHSGVRSWSDIRSHLIDAYHEASVPYEAAQCSVCSVLVPEDDFIVCKDCGPFTFFCGTDCCQIRHRQTEQTHLFHKPELWTVSMKD